MRLQMTLYCVGFEFVGKQIVAPRIDRLGRFTKNTNGAWSLGGNSTMGAPSGEDLTYIHVYPKPRGAQLGISELLNLPTNGTRL